MDANSLQTIGTFGTYLIAAIVAWIAIQQYYLARAKFKLDLFEKRFAVYKATQKFLSAIMGDPNIQWDRAVEFLRDKQDSVFLFDDETVNYLDSLYKKAVDMIDLKDDYDPLPSGTERTDLVKRKSELRKQLTEELPKLKDVFRPYLQFKNWK